MPMIPLQPDDGHLDAGPTTVPAAHGWLDGAWAWITGPNGTLLTTALTAAFLGGLFVQLNRRAPKNRDTAGRALMYLPLLLINAAAVYGQVAFFYETVAPAAWPMPGKLALGMLIAAAIESIAVYVGWHAHDALLQKASATAARLRRWSYVIAGLVGAINYAHFAGDHLTPTAAAVAFGLLSLLSPWLWGLHTRRIQHIQLTREGAIDVTGATFSGERIRSFPIRAWAARRWSIDHYVTDPRQAWEGYNAHLERRRTFARRSRLGYAWAALCGEVPAGSAFAQFAPTVIHGGTQPARPLPTQSARTKRTPTLAPTRSLAIAERSLNGSHPANPTPTQPEIPVAKPAATVAEQQPAKPIEKPAEKLERTVRKPVAPFTDDPNPSIRALAKAYARKPTGTNGELAKVAKVSEGTANRYLPQIRRAAVDSANADADEERAQGALTLTPFALHRESAQMGTNGYSHATPEEH